MSEGIETQTQGAPEEKPERTFTQAEVEETVKERLARERKKYADYAALKAKAEKFDEAEEAAKSDLQKATERADKLQKELDGIRAQMQRDGIVAKVAKDFGVDAEILAAMNGATEDEVSENARMIKDKLSSLPAYPTRTDDGGGNARRGKPDIPIIF